MLTVLAARGIPIDAEIRARITACTDDATLDRWIAGAAVALSVEEAIAEAQEGA